MSSKKHLEFIYNRMVNVHGENPDIDYMIEFKAIIEESQIQEAYLLDAVHKLVELKFKDSKQDLAQIIMYSIDKNDELFLNMAKSLSEGIDNQKESIYNQYGITKQKLGKI